MLKTKNRAISFITAMVLCLSAVLFVNFNASAEEPVGFHVSGTTILDANGNPFVMRGINVPHAWYTQNTSQSVSNCSTGANTVRVVLGDGDKYNKNSVSDVSNVINMCKNMVLCVFLKFTMQQEKIQFHI